MSQALFSPCRKYRYSLHRTVQQSYHGVRPCIFVMLNPSTADENVDDPTIRRCTNYARTWKCTDLIVVNLFPFRATDPKELKWQPQASWDVEGQNDQCIAEAIYTAKYGDIVAAWGANPIATERASRFMNKWGSGYQIMCLGKTQSGAPRHPLYVPAATPLEVYRGPGRPETEDRRPEVNPDAL
jgi:hypothetical protein